MPVAGYSVFQILMVSLFRFLKFVRFSHALPVNEPRISAGPARIFKPAARFNVVARESGSGFAVIVALALLFVIQSRLSELIVIRFGGYAYLGKILFAIGLPLVVLTGGWKRALSSRPGALLLLLTGVFLAAIPFSLWKGGSTELIVGSWFRALAYFFVIAGSLQTIPQCRSALYTIGLSGALIAIQSHFFAADSTTRLQLDEGTLANPNDLAFALLLGIPCCILVVRQAENIVLRIGGGLLACLFLVTIVQTGSRGGLIVLGVMLIFLFFTSPVAVRLVEVGGFVVLVVVSLAAAPQDVLERYRLMVSGEPSGNGEISWEAGAAVGSTESRKEVLKQSLVLTLQHPLLGVGPGMFPVAVADEHKASGTDEAAAWRETHNAYTQVASECGLPAVVLFVSILVYSFRANIRIHRDPRNRADARGCAYCLLLALIAYAVNGVFMSNAYGFALPMLAGLTASLEHANAASMRPPSPQHPG